MNIASSLDSWSRVGILREDEVARARSQVSLLLCIAPSIKSRQHSQPCIAFLHHCQQDQMCLWSNCIRSGVAPIAHCVHCSCEDGGKLDDMFRQFLGKRQFAEMANSDFRR